MRARYWSDDLGIDFTFYKDIRFCTGDTSGSVRTMLLWHMFSSDFRSIAVRRFSSPPIQSERRKPQIWIQNRNARVSFRLRQRCVTSLIHDNMDEPPPYSARDPIVLVRRIADFIDYHDYPKLCLVSSIWRDVFQAHMWTQPDRYFTTRNRSTTGRSHSSLLGDRLME